MVGWVSTEVANSLGGKHHDADGVMIASTMTGT